MIPQIENLKNTDSGNFFLLADPCAIEGEKMAMKIAATIVFANFGIVLLLVLNSNISSINTQVLLIVLTGLVLSFVPYRILKIKNRKTKRNQMSVKTFQNSQQTRV